MSRRNSVGDLVPRDITEVLAREAKTNKAKRKNGGSLSRALGWFRGDRKKKSDGGGRPEPRGRVADSQTAKHSHTEPDCTKGQTAAETQDVLKLILRNLLGRFPARRGGP